MCVCVWVGGWWEGECDVIFNITRGVRTNFYGFGGSRPAPF